MSIYNIHFYSVLLVVISERCCFDKVNWIESNSNRSFHLQILVLSARENLEKRSIIRQTWFQNVKFYQELFDSKKIPFKIDANFVLGAHSCLVHPLNRKNYYECSERRCPADKSSSERKFYLFESLNYGPTLLENDEYKIYRGLSFKVNSPIVINRIGVFVDLLADSELVNLQFIDAFSKNKLYDLNYSRRDTLIKDFYFKSMNFSLTLGTTLILIVDHVPVLKSPQRIKSKFKNSDCHLEILRSYHGFYDHESIPFERDKHSFYINFLYQIKDSKNEINQFDNNSKVWLKKVHDLETRLEKESNLFHDITFVPVVDIYRNLPQKLVSYFQRSVRIALDPHSRIDLMNPFSFVEPRKQITHILKTDDDCFLDIFNVIRMLSAHLDDKFTWLGNFRKMWPINYYGKWTENYYTAPFYPMFACGSGYILTRDLVDWIILNSKHLFFFQGEDVSLGIWLSSINAKKIQKNGWLCGNEPGPNVGTLLSVPQIDDQTMLKLYDETFQ